ncbi:hypothetical protein B0O99DRAFT_615335 [Bisporella sp. PMI_857]|nr:hypothetical protein B0O99DRAFT_615335 [Bisporella sp. PMI_857]
MRWLMVIWSQGKRGLNCMPASAGLYGGQSNHSWPSLYVCHSFRGICGATVSFWCERRRDLVSVNVGI